MDDDSLDDLQTELEITRSAFLALHRLLRETIDHLVDPGIPPSIMISSSIEEVNTAYLALQRRVQVKSVIFADDR